MIKMCFKPASHCPASRALIGQYAEGGPAYIFFLHFNLLSISFDYWQNINKKRLTFKETNPSKNVRQIFRNLEDLSGGLHIICICTAYSLPSLACRSMLMKVHQTLVWLNLLSFGTKDLAAPTIGIQSAANHSHKNVHQHSLPSLVDRWIWKYTKLWYR